MRNYQKQMLTQKFRCQNEGFTFIELILYIGAMSIIALSLFYMISLVLQARVQNQTITQVEQQGLQIMQTIGQTIKEAEDINTPLPGTEDSQLSLVFSDSLKNPTLFYVANNTVYITEGSDDPIRLSSSRVSITDLTFSNLAKSETPDIIRIRLTIHYQDNSKGLQEYQYTQTFYTAATLH